MCYQTNNWRLVIKILKMVVIQLRREWSGVRPSSISGVPYTSYVKTRSRRHSAQSRQSYQDNLDNNNTDCESLIDMKQVKYGLIYNFYLVNKLPCNDLLQRKEDKCSLHNNNFLLH